MSERTYCLYVHTAPNGKKYVGITSRNPKRRWVNGHGYKGLFFSRAIKKYGWENITHEILFTGLSREEAGRLEREYIQKFGTTDREKGYNLSLGGELPSNNMANVEEYRLRQSINTHNTWKERPQTYSASKHKKPPVCRSNNYKKKVYQYSKDGELIAIHESIAACAEALGVTKMPVSEACNHKDRTCKGYVLKFKDDTFLSNGKRGSWQSLPVTQIDIDGNAIKTFPSALEAARSFGKTTSCTILGACRGKQITAYGYRWCFA